MIDPFKIVDFNRTQTELEEFLLFCIVAANKPAVTQAKKLDEFLGGRSPFRYVRGLLLRRELSAKLEEHRLSPYRKNVRAFTEAVRSHVPLREVSLSGLIQVHGIGDKTARMFLLYSRRGTQYAVLDTHVLSWLRVNGHKTPAHHPTGPSYRRLEATFLSECKQRGMTPLAMDRKIWTERAIGGTR